MIVVKRLENPTDEQIKDIGDLCVRAYAKDAVMNAMLGGDLSLEPEYWRAHTRATALEGELYVITNGEHDRIVSMASLFGPGRAVFGSEEQRQLGFYDFFQKLSEEAQHWQKETCPSVIAKLDAKFFTNEEIETRWWCFNLATDPSYQHRGFASTIMNTLFKRADETGALFGLAAVPIKNVEYYRSIGLTERGEGKMPAPTGDFYIHLMSREPQLY